MGALRKFAYGSGLAIGLAYGSAYMEAKEFYDLCDRSDEANLPPIDYEADIISAGYVCPREAPNCGPENALATFTGEGNVLPIPFEQMSRNFTDSIIANEDRDFYRRDRIDTARVAGLISLRTITSSLRNRQFSAPSGASNIEMQTARTIFVSSTPGDTACRKLFEISVGNQLNEIYATDANGDGVYEGKQYIAEQHANYVYYGRNAYGVEAAARAYLGKSAEDLTLVEGAFLAGLIQSPVRMEGSEDPTRNQDQMDRAQRRLNETLSNLVESGLRSQAEVNAALAVPGQASVYDFVTPYDNETVQSSYESDYAVTNMVGARHFTQMAINAAMTELGITQEDLRNGVRINTTLSMDMQADLVNSINDTPRPHDGRQIAAVVLGQDGDVLALYGGDWSAPNGQNNLATTPAPVGSSLKPYVYASALDNGTISTGQSFVEEQPPIVWPGVNTNGTEWSVTEGDHCPDPNNCSLNDAVARSSNPIPITILRDQGQDGIDNFIQDMRDYGMDSATRNVPAAALGSWETSVLDLAEGQNGLIANQGMNVSTNIIDSVTREQSDGQFVDIDNGAFDPAEPNRVNSPETAAAMTDAMRGTVRYGTASQYLNDIATDTAGKTGSVPGNAGAYFTGVSATSLGNLTLSVGMRHAEGLIDMGEGSSGGNIPALVYRKFMDQQIDQQRSIN